MTDLIIAHGEDLDGIVSHTLLEIHTPGSAHVLVKYGSLQADFDRAYHLLKGDAQIQQVYVADISFGDSLFKVVDEMSKLAPVTWIDHHDATKKNIEKLMAPLKNNVAYHQVLCSSEIVGLRYSMYSDYANHLANLAQRSDYPDRFTQTKLGKKLEKVIALLNFRKDEAEMIKLIHGLTKEGEVISPFMDSLAPQWEGKVEEYNHLEKAALSALYENGQVYTIGNVPVIFSHTSTIIPGKQATRALRDHFSEKANMFVVLFDSESSTQNHWILREEKFSFPAVELCEYLGGGGRGKGGGFPWTEAVNASNYVKVSEAIAQRMEASGYFR